MDKATSSRYIKLQDAIAKCYAIEVEKNKIPSEIQEKKDALNLSKTQHQDLLEQLAKYQRYLQNNSKVLKEIEIKRDESEKKIEKVATQREFDRENAILESCRDREHKIYDANERINSRITLLKDRIAASQVAQKEIAEAIEAQIKELEVSINDVEQRLEKARAEKEKLSKGVDAELLFKFERIIKNKGGIGRVALVSNVCQGCHMELPQQFVNKVRKNDEIMFCPYCSRILMWQEGEVDSEILDADKKYYDVRIKEDKEIAEGEEFTSFASSEDDITSDEDVDMVERGSMIADESEFDL